MRRHPARALLVASLLVAAVALASLRSAEPDGGPFGPGVAILAAAALLVGLLPRWWTELAAVLSLALVVANRLGDLGSDLLGEHGLRVGLASWTLLVALGVAAAVVAPPLARAARRRAARAERTPRTREPRAPRPRQERHLGLAAGLMVLSAICAEDLAAYDDTTGQPAELLAGVLIFGFLYGGPALLIRELVRRTGRGWPAMLLLATAAGLLQAGLVDQSMFNDDYRDIESWDELWGQTRIDALGLSAYATQAFIVGHVVYSFCAPIALMEAVRPTAAGRSWVGWPVLAIVGALYVAVAGLVLGDTLAQEAAEASLAQIVGSLAVIAALVAAALRTGRPASSPEVGAPRVAVVLACSFVAATLLAIAPPTWAGAALSGLVLVASGVLLVQASRRAGWRMPHVVAVAAGAVLSRALVAFTYDPVIGDVSPARKYAHNVVMLLIVGAVIALAFQRSRSEEGS